MKTIYFHSSGMIVLIEFPASIEAFIKIIFPDFENHSEKPATIKFKVRVDNNDCYELFENNTCLAKHLDAQHCSLTLMHEMVRALANQYKTSIALHAGAVIKDNKAIVLPAKSGAGKTSLAAWLAANGYDYLTDELVLFNRDKTLNAFYRPLNIKASGLEALKSLQKNTDQLQEFTADAVTIWSADLVGRRASVFHALKLGLFIFPLYLKDSELKIEALTPAQTGLELMACNINARNFADHGFKFCVDLAKSSPAIRLTYSRFEQLDEVLPALIDMMLSGVMSSRILKKLITTNLPAVTKEEAKPDIPTVIPLASKLGKKKKLCIGMATYDDFDGVYFSVQAIRLFHPEVTDQIEIIVLDNNPVGKGANDLKALDSKIENYRYIPMLGKTGTAVRDSIFEFANADYVICMDCHVLIEPGAIAKLINYFDSEPECEDLLQGPMLSDDLNNISTHFNPVWNKGMYGTWGCDDRAKQHDAPAFDIPMQGLGLFACRKDSWQGFNQSFRGFGGEEGYIHEKFRQAGARTLCLPFLRWLHRFARPIGVPYPVNWQDRIRNYLIGFSELGLDTAPIIEHFTEFLNEELTLEVVNSFKKEFDSL